ncbi:GNAT family N-acetyltransferase [Mesorhizobium shonense]|uniref:GNAT family N-acetyltransferase n=1 Tax=Mesorhizobium shonense TaxID=1209948 RepID=UPI0033946808
MLAAGGLSFWKRTESWCRSAPGPPETSEPVQIGGVWTPPEVRNRGYGRAVATGALREAARDGVTRAVLFRRARAVRRSYEALGSRQIGDYGITRYPT